ncbi:MAG TPA: caspase family protein, partial [Methylomirabilota bacterium]
MPATRRFERLDLEAFFDVLDQFPFERRINAVHMHHTWRPAHAHWRDPEQMLLSMWRFHTVERGFADIAQHVTIDPEGGIWTGRNWNLPPASAFGHNGSRHAGPFMFEMVGDFDQGRDRWMGPQRECALSVAALVLARFGLTAEQGLRFHNQMSAKTCPGTAIDFEAVIAEVARLMAELPDRLRGRARSLTEFDTEDSPQRAATRRIVVMMQESERVRALGGGPWHDEGEPEEEEMSPAALDALTAGGTGARALGERELSPAQLESLRPHVVNLRFGAFSPSGAFRTGPEDVDRIFGEHLPRYLEEQRAAGRTGRLLFYAHGGLVGEQGGLAGALDHLGFHRDNGVFPIFFVWETGLLESVADLFRRTLGGARGLLSDASDRIVEALSREGGVRIWGHMKRSAEVSVLRGGGALYVAQQAAAFCKAHQAQLEVHAAGHSAGSIFHAWFVPELLAQGVSAVGSVHLLAPAVNVPTFKQTLLPEVAGGRIGELCVYTMREALERSDTAGPYRKSLLYLVHHAFEEPDETPILGLEEHMRRDRDVADLFGLGGAAGHPAAHLVLSQTPADAPPDRASRATTHGAFDNDAATMNSVIRRVLGAGADERVEDFEARPRVRIAPAEDPLAAVARELAAPAAPRPGAAAGRVGFGRANATGPRPAPEERVEPAVPAPAPTAPMPETPPVPEAGPAVWAPSGPRTVHALCIGINSYARAPLSGCIHDSMTWASALGALGFEVTTVPETEGTRAGLTRMLREAVRRTRPGDTVIFQYAGHGIRIDDQGNADEPVDEAFVPIDFETNGFLRDDEVRLILDELPVGANATLIIDCCHSGGLARLVPGMARGDERPREIPLTPDLLEVH